MPLILSYAESKNIYKTCGDASITMARIGYSDQHHLISIIEGGKKFSQEFGIKQLPIGVFSTVGHYIFQMLPRCLVADHVLPSEGGNKLEYQRKLHRNACLATEFMSSLTDESDVDYGNSYLTHRDDHGYHTLPGRLFHKMNC